MSVYTDISSTRVDADSPVDEDLMGDLADNDKSLRERTIRSGTHATGVRTAMARGRKAFAANPAGSTDHTFTVTISFTTECDDGNPNFSAAPRVYLTVEEDDSGANELWIGTHTISAVSPFIATGTLTATGFTATVKFHDNNVDDLAGFLHFIAIGPVTSGE